MLYTIGQFAQLTGLPPKTLRYYDEIALLKPAVTDENTGYRYYKPPQMLLAEKIKLYRECNLSIRETREMLLIETGLCSADARQSLARKEQELEHQLGGIQKLLGRIRELRAAEERLSNVQIQLKEAIPMRILSLRTVPDFDDSRRSIQQLVDYARDKRLTVRSAPFFLWGDEVDESGRPAIGAVLPVMEKLEPPEPFRYGALPGGQVASVTHHGRYNEIGLQYNALLLWTAENNCTIDGPLREIHLDADPGAGEAERHVEIQAPLRFADGRR